MRRCVVARHVQSDRPGTGSVGAGESANKPAHMVRVGRQCILQLTPPRHQNMFCSMLRRGGPGLEDESLDGGSPPADFDISSQNKANAQSLDGGVLPKASFSYFGRTNVLRRGISASGFCNSFAKQGKWPILRRGSFAILDGAMFQFRCLLFLDGGHVLIPT